LLSNILKRFFSYFGFTITKSKYDQPLELLSSEPFLINYISTFKRQIVINAPLENGRGFEVFSLSHTSIHPLIVASKMYIDTGDINLVESVLCRYYESVNPQDIYDWLGVSEKSNQLSADCHPPWATILPWENVTPEKKIQHRIATAKYDSAEHGERHIIAQGWRNFGPVSPEVISLEAKRIVSLCDSIKRLGFKRHSNSGGDIGAIILVNEDLSWRWLVENGGQHRSAVLSALNYEVIPIRVWSIVYRREVLSWPGVTAGIFTQSQALKIFDNIFIGDNVDILDEYKKILGLC